MSMLEYIQEIQRQFVRVYGFASRPDAPDIPKVNPPDGVYPMRINGKTDDVAIIDGYINCCNFSR